MIRLRPDLLTDRVVHVELTGHAITCHAQCLNLANSNLWGSKQVTDINMTR